jgi:hypothetical protein
MEENSLLTSSAPLHQNHIEGPTMVICQDAKCGEIETLFPDFWHLTCGWDSEDLPIGQFLIFPKVPRGESGWFPDRRNVSVGLFKSTWEGETEKEQKAVREVRTMSTAWWGNVGEWAETAEAIVLPRKCCDTT